MTPEESLFELSVAYAHAADRRDAGAFCAVFHPDGALHLCGTANPETVTHTRRGQDELADVVERLRRYDRTYHLLGQAGYDVEHNTASGEVYCVAHHLDIDNSVAGNDAAARSTTAASNAASNRVLYIRYGDTYRRDSDGTWKINERTVHIDWTETRPADSPAHPIPRPTD